MCGRSSRGYGQNDQIIRLVLSKEPDSGYDDLSSGMIDVESNSRDHHILIILSLSRTNSDYIYLH